MAPNEKAAETPTPPGARAKTSEEEAEEDGDAFREFVDVGEATDDRKTQDALPAEKAFERLRAGVVGTLDPVDTPFGVKPLVYADWTASGRAFGPIETYVREKVYPFYANTHTSSSITGLQSTCFRAEARQIIQQAVNANTRTDVVLFAGTGATGAVNKLVSVLGLDAPLRADEVSRPRPVVFVGPFEHHSNLLPWRESSAEVVCVPERQDGLGIDRDALAELLRTYADRPLLVGAFSAGSNVSGVLEDVDRISALLHRHGALACWDYAAAGPYARIDMNPVLAGEDPDRPFAYKDAVFLSTHKFVGGINTPGVLVAKKKLFGNAVPGTGSVGGGTVYFVREDGHRYLSNRVEREEGGTPDVVGAIRAGLAFQLKQSVGWANIEARDKVIGRKIAAKLGSEPKLVLLGPKWGDAEGSRLPIVSFLVRHGTRFLHYNFVSAVLNDVFGIQTRGGCMCAGLYAQRLLGLSRESVEAIEDELLRNPKHSEYLRPGFSRLSLAYFASDEELDYVLDAVCAVAQLGWKLLPQYRFNTRTGEWKHKSRFTKFPGRLWLGDANLLGATPSEPENEDRARPDSYAFPDLLQQGIQQMDAAAEESAKETLGDQTQLFTPEAAPLRWFAMPSEVHAELSAGSNKWAAAPVEVRASEGKEGEEDNSALTSNPVTGPLDPFKYWAMVRESMPVAPALTASDESDNAADRARKRGPEAKEEPAKRAKAKTEKSSTVVVCEDNSCFRVRKRDKYPLRTAEVIRSDQAAQNLAQPQADAAVVAPKAPPKALRPRIPKGILKNVGKALAQWEMIQEGDRLLLGLSGGKDSLALLHVLLHVQAKSPVKFELAACTVDPMTEAFDPSPLIPYMASLGVTYHYLKEPIFDRAKSGSLQGTSICSFCARMKRGALYGCAREHGYNKLVLAQHLDDSAETLMMGLFHNGIARAMMANYEEKKGDVRVIRPLAYVREHETKAFSYAAKLPVINENCPACFEAPQERQRIKRMLAKEEATCPRMFHSLRRALLPLMDADLLTEMSAITSRRTDLANMEQRRVRAADHKQRKQEKEQAKDKEKEKEHEEVAAEIKA
ncbi:Cytoplasmic tRNA 2-thiolation protein 1 [Hondaea fermentalgiana]|uniref:Cytoplasmic tRNA 2-thiolation protein 1 n=1 Tax=Hondaea fermentalgiana TaxID=2315210 RepID=A0A2R5G6L3_9STRA|nr:Cytoplasmic tRNA 2-thiolation protein 1 [Hondaea fermentalgiana]|eukprot:GBG25428.1 Cytoplasmic tRNA 2-thiolation protein 1 [Hondaea fermentalgiana]